LAHRHGHACADPADAGPHGTRCAGRGASRLWASLTDARGVDGRDALWAHPDMLPTATDLDDPDGFVHREQIDFSELDKMLGEAADKPGLKKEKNEGEDENKGDGSE
ncbi:zinc-dependent metalloprotease, partial [Streptomyces sp. NPDC004976]